MKLLLSLIICTHNRVNNLEMVLRDLTVAPIPNKVEIIVVDNNSTDSTKESVEKYKKKSKQIRYIPEPKLNLSVARNTGWRNALGKYVGYLDDDCRVPKDWLIRITKIIQDKTPDIFGGPYVPFYLSPKPSWFKDSYESNIQQKKAGPLKKGKYLPGANIFFKSKLLQKSGGFKVGLGPTGRNPGYGDETELIHRIKSKMPEIKIYCDPAITVQHLVPVHKMRLFWLAYRSFLSGRFSERAIPNQALSNSRFTLLRAMRPTVTSFFWDISIGTILRNRKVFPYWQNYIYENSSAYLIKLGLLYEKFHNQPGRKAHPNAQSR